MSQFFVLALTILAAGRQPTVKPDVTNTTQWTQVASAKTPPNVVAYHHPSGAIISAGLVYSDISDGAAMGHIDALLDNPSIKVTQILPIDDNVFIASWERTSKTGAIVAKGRLAVGPLSRQFTPLLYLYWGEWKPELDEQMEKPFLQAFLNRPKRPFYRL